VSKTADEIRRLPRRERLVRFAIGLALMVLFVGTIMSGITPPGIAGEVLRHNRAADIDASPLFYSEVEHMARLEQGVRQLRLEADAQN
jgi:hypothetical protein